MPVTGTRRQTSGPVAPCVAVARKIVAMRKQRRAYLPWVSFNEPAWDMMLHLFIAEHHGQQQSISSLCGASRVSESTALRQVAELIANGYLIRRPDPYDRRRSLIALSPGSVRQITAYLRRMAVIDDEE
jgi:DNA-binding MarR family transcriptional regulator